VTHNKVWFLHHRKENACTLQRPTC